MKPVYLPMPVSFEEKREWNKKGFKVVDEAFKPVEDLPVDPVDPVDPIDHEPQAPVKQKPKGGQPE